MPRRPPPSGDPLARTDRLLVDGSNLLHAMRRTTAAMPPAAAIGRLRGVIPPTIGVELILDGPPDRGLHGSRIASGLIVRHSLRRSADELIVELVDEARRVGDGTANAVDNLLVVSDDRELRETLRTRGVRTAGTQWLIGRMDRGRLAAPSVGNRRRPGLPE